MKPFVMGWVYYPVSRLTDLAKVKKELTVKPVQFKGKEKPKPIQVYDETSHDGYIGLPKRYAIDRLKALYADAWVNRIDDYSIDNRDFHPPHLPNLEHEDAHVDQKIIVPEVLEKLRENHSSLLVADTGVGKTAIALSVAAQLQQKTLILVNSEKLKNQWVSEIQLHLGVAKEDIGIIQGAKCEKEKDIAVGMVQTIYKGKYDEELENEYGMVIFDEVHNLGADEFSKCLGICNARYNLGMTATDDRSDGKDEVYKLHFGDGDVRAEAEALPCKVHVLPHARTNGPNWGETPEAKLLCVSKDYTRNLKLAQLIARLAKAGRNVIIFSAFKRHLKALFEMAVKYGLNPQVAGHLYIGSGAMQKESQMPLVLKEKDYHDHVINNSQVIFTVFKMAKEGISIKRLDAGLCAVPQSKVKQLIGRIRRDKHGKLPIWYDIHDTDDEMLSGFCMNRIRQYKADKTVELVRHDGGT